MLKSIITLVILTGSFGSLAHAEESVPVTVSIEYDVELLKTETGSQQLLLDIKRQARDACGTFTAISAIKTYDRTCVADIMSEAVAHIQDKQLSDGKAVPRVFASLAAGATSVTAQR